MALPAGSILQYLLTIKVGTTEVGPEMVSAAFGAEDAPDGFTPFGTPPGKVKQFYVIGKAIQRGVIWKYSFNNPGTQVGIVMRPYGPPSQAASSAMPIYTATATIAALDGIFLGGDRGDSLTTPWLYDFKWILTDQPTEVTSTS